METTVKCTFCPKKFNVESSKDVVIYCVECVFRKYKHIDANTVRVINKKKTGYITRDFLRKYVLDLSRCTFCDKLFDIISVDDMAERTYEKNIYCAECIFKYFSFDCGKREYLTRLDLFQYGLYGRYRRISVSDILSDKIPDELENDYCDDDEDKTHYMCCICQSKFLKILTCDCSHKYCNDCLMQLFDSKVKTYSDFSCAMCRKIYLRDDGTTFEEFKLMYFEIKKIKRYNNKDIFRRHLDCYLKTKNHKFLSSLTTHKSAYYKIYKPIKVKREERKLLLKKIRDRYVTIINTNTVNDQSRIYRDRLIRFVMSVRDKYPRSFKYPVTNMMDEIKNDKYLQLAANDKKRNFDGIGVCINPMYENILFKSERALNIPTKRMNYKTCVRK